MFAEIPKAANQYSLNSASCTDATSNKTKEQTTKALGFEKTQVHRLETIAGNKEFIAWSRSRGYPHELHMPVKHIIHLIHYDNLSKEISGHKKSAGAK